jgi:hypothetical protein
MRPVWSFNVADTVLVEFTIDELRLLEPAAQHQLEQPLGVYPGPDRDARAQLSGALKILRARYVAGGWKFIALSPALAPFATRLIAETCAPGKIEAVAPPPPKPARRARKSRPRRRAVAAGRTRSAEIDAALAYAASPIEVPAGESES